MATVSRLLAALSAVCFGGLATSTYGASNSLSDTFSSLAGRWSGEGTVKPATGPAERFNCVVTYIPQGNSTRLRQNLRCKSANYQLDAATHLELRGERVVGRWQDNIYTGLNGTVSGVVKDGGFDIVLSGQFFTAKMTIVGSGCQQVVRVAPARADYIREVSASLRKC
nr:MAG: hypothetical protein DIU57_07985 [Pseudomonadota bacterium]